MLLTIYCILDIDYICVENYVALFSPFIKPTFYFVEGEIDYVRVLNRVLPNDIRILGWCPAPVDFHARFVCILHNFSFLYDD